MTDANTFNSKVYQIARCLFRQLYIYCCDTASKQIMFDVIVLGSI